MLDSIEQSFVNYYEVLEVTEDADTADIEEALEHYEESMTFQLNNPLTMQSARYAINTLIPAIRQHLLSGQATRQHYDQQLTEFKRQQSQMSEQDELPDDEGLDLLIRQPFFFDPYDGYDTETPAYTLRAVAERLDAEWARARSWITDTSAATHSLVGYLTHAALRPRLGARVEEITQAVTSRNGRGMHPDEAIERCIMLLNPPVERPRVGVQELREGGSMFHAGSFLSDHSAASALTLYHTGRRGCAFGTVESRTPWLTLQSRQPTMRFALMPESTDHRISPSQMKIPLHFDVRSLAHNASHTADLIIRMENNNPPIELPIQVLIYIPALPPRVVFDPPATTPLSLGSTRRGQLVKTVVMPHNVGDEEHIPLVAQISSDDAGANAEPACFHDGEPVTLTVDSGTRPYGSNYHVTFHINYHMTPGASGPTTFHLYGEILPTVWQSMLRTKALRKRLSASGITLLVGLVWFGSLAGIIASHTLAALIFFCALPFCLSGATYLSIDALLPHIQRSGYFSLQKRNISPWIRWVFPLGTGCIFALICGLILHVDSAIVVGCIIGALVGGAIGFLADSARLLKTK
jgi:hypothetical protein